ncbi:helix-turn-helix transcriptional regulator [Robiginitalea sp.]|uniref:helix-turn-helix transcriptional regulator n=1 Tax=Robiginitalea sp. TaxID=1902411 RepID=UPI003C77B1AB
MVNTVAFKERLEQILTHYDLNASAFADAIGVQRSSISHLLSGRNKPSLDFVLKVVREFPEVNLYWLLNGRGEFPDSAPVPAKEPKPPLADPRMGSTELVDSEIESIVVFYKDGSFRKFLPSRTK